MWSFCLQAAPVDGIEPVLDEIGVGTGEWTAAEKSTAGRKRAWVWAFDDMVAVCVDESDFALRVRTPEDEDHGCLARGKLGDDGVGECFPAMAGVALWASLGDGEGGVQKEHALLSPAEETAVVWTCAADVALHFFENIQQRWRRLHTGTHGKAESVGLPWPVIRVLSDNNHLRFVIRTEVESIKNQLSRRITSRRTILLTNEIRQLHEIRLLKFRSQMLFPARFYLYIHKLFL